MPPIAPQDATRVEPGQYLIRHLLLLITALAAILVALMPLLRTLATPAQLVIGGDAALFLVTLLASQLWISWQRHKAVQTAGPPLTQYSAEGARKGNWQLLYIAGWNLAVLALFAWGPHPEITHLIDGPRSYRTWLHAGLHLLFVSQAAFFLNLALLDVRAAVSILEVGSRGIILRCIYTVRFSDIRRWAWSGESQRMQINLFLANRTVIHALASREHQVAIDRHLAENVRA